MELPKPFKTSFTMKFLYYKKFSAYLISRIENGLNVWLLFEGFIKRPYDNPPLSYIFKLGFFLHYQSTAMEYAINKYREYHCLPIDRQYYR